MANILLSRITNTHVPSVDDSYPFSIPAIKALKTLEFTSDVTYLIGENGSGKSTLMEAIAVKMGMNAEGGGQNFRFSTKETHSNLSEALRLTKTPYRLNDNFFYRADLMYAAVKVYLVVVAYLFESLLAVPAVQVIYCVVASLRGGAAVDYDFCYCSHSV